MRVEYVIVRTRIEKWANYRAKITAMPDEKFKAVKRQGTPMGQNDLSFVDSLPKSKNGIRTASSAAAVANKTATPYAVYEKRKRQWFIAKCVLLLLAIIGFTLLWFYWVLGE